MKNEKILQLTTKLGVAKEKATRLQRRRDRLHET